MYLKTLQKLRCLVAFQNRPSAPIGRDEDFKFLEGQFCKEKPLSTKRKLISILLYFLFPCVSFSSVFLIMKCETLFLSTTA